MKAYKGFNEDLTCRGFQYEEGKSYHEDEAKLCESGFHACLNPIYCLDFYSPNKAVYHEVELDGVTEENSTHSKVCGTDVTIGKRLSVKEICEAHFEYVKNHTNNTSGTCASYREPIDATTAVCHDCAFVDNSSGLIAVDGLLNNAFRIGDHSVAAGVGYTSFQGKNYDIIAGGANCLISADARNVIACDDENMVSVGDENIIASNRRCSIEAGNFNVIAANWSSHVKAGDNNTITGGYTLESGQNSTVVGRWKCSGGPNSVVVARGCGVQVKEDWVQSS